MGAGRSGMGVVIALCLTSFGPLSLGLSCAGIFYPSLSADTGVSAGLLSYYTSAVWIASLATLPLLGRLFTRLGARVCVAAASAIMAIDFIALSFTNGFAWFMACGFVMGIGVAMLLFLAPSTLVNRWFSKRAGTLLGVVMAFTGIGGAAWCAVGGLCIEMGGWQIAYRLFGALSVVLGVVPAVLLVRDAPTTVAVADEAESAYAAEAQEETPEGGGDAVSERTGYGCEGRSPHIDINRHPYLSYRCEDGAVVPGAPVSQLSPTVAERVRHLRKRMPLRDSSERMRSGAAATARGGYAATRSGETESPASSERLLPNEVGVSARHASASGLLLLIADIAFILNFGMFIYFIIPSYASSLPAAMAFPLLGAIASSAAMAGQTISKVALGFVGDRAPVAGAAAGVIAGLVGMAVLWFCAGEAVLVLAGAFLFGAYYGVANVMMPLFTRLGFGMRDYPRIYAKVSMAASLGAIVSGLLWGTVIGVTDGYAELFVGVAALLCIALALIAVLARRLERQGAY